MSPSADEQEQREQSSNDTIKRCTNFVLPPLYNFVAESNVFPGYSDSSIKDQTDPFARHNSKQQIHFFVGLLEIENAFCETMKFCTRRAKSKHSLTNLCRGV